MFESIVLNVRLMRIIAFDMELSRIFGPSPSPNLNLNPYMNLDNSTQYGPSCILYGPDYLILGI